MTRGGPPILIDLGPLAGFSYACRPDCGLCCYAEPLVTPADRNALVQIAPELTFSRRGRNEFIGSNPDGGACRLLEANRCRAHSARPSPCREFPLTAHVGTRVQATVVLSCPGVDLASLDEYRGPARAPPPEGFDSEVSALRARVDDRVRRRLDTVGRRRHRIERTLAEQGRWVEESEVRRRLANDMPTPGRHDFPADDPPSRAEGLEHLPLFFDDRDGPVAFARHPTGWELVELAPAGGIVRSLGVARPPDRPPAMAPTAARTLQGYLRYWLERDLLFGVVHLDMLGDPAGSVTDRVAAELRRIGADALSRAQVLATVRRGDPGTLTTEDLRDGVRATDQDLLDRESWGSRL